MVIPAHPLALTPQRRLDERRQRALTRYYLDAGAGGVAVAVHTTQFAIHEPKCGLLRPVLELAAATATSWRPDRRTALIAGVIGATRQAIAEAELARSCGYDAVLLSLGALRTATAAELIAHARSVAAVMPVVGFYLQPAVGGRPLDYRFWRRFAEIENVVAIKVAPFDRYATIDVIRAVADSGRGAEISLYTGNDDHIVLDLLTRHAVGGGRPIRMVGGLLGHWAFWTRTAVRHHASCRRVAATNGAVPPRLLTLAAQVTDANAAVFDAANRFRGCIAGIHEVLRRQGLLAGRWCLDRDEDLSPGQDDAFVREGLDRWLR
jgi:dihydrodipicolinate synthase/N-acetylneuraminate lyase